MTTTTRTADQRARVYPDLRLAVALATLGSFVLAACYSFAEPSFSPCGCEICGSSLGGNFEPWHGVGDNGEIVHGDQACVDCTFYLANGDLPEKWEG